jgi:SAM-dependent methyltransferase
VTPIAVARAAVAALPPGLRWRARNTIALARWLWLRAVRGDAEGAFAEDFWQLHGSGDWDAFADVILRYCHPRSIVDVGCGDAKLLIAARRRQPSLPVLGIDSTAVGLRRASAAGVPVERCDLSSTRRRHVEQLAARIASFDVAVSLETAEHLPPWSGPAFVDALANARLVVFSAAQPGQGGTLHLNERSLAYWQAQFQARAYAPAAAGAELRAAIARLQLPPWYAANVQLFERRA